MSRIEGYDDMCQKLAHAAQLQGQAAELMSRVDVVTVGGRNAIIQEATRQLDGQASVITAITRELDKLAKSYQRRINRVLTVGRNHVITQAVQLARGIAHVLLPAQGILQAELSGGEPGLTVMPGLRPLEPGTTQLIETPGGLALFRAPGEPALAEESPPVGLAGTPMVPESGLPPPGQRLVAPGPAPFTLEEQPQLPAPSPLPPADAPSWLQWAVTAICQCVQAAGQSARPDADFVLEPWRFVAQENAEPWHLRLIDYFGDSVAPIVLASTMADLVAAGTGARSVPGPRQYPED